MSPRSKGVMKVRRTASRTSRRNRVGLVLVTDHLVAQPGKLIAAVERGAQGFGAIEAYLRVALEQVEELVLLRHQGL